MKEFFILKDWAFIFLKLHRLFLLFYIYRCSTKTFQYFAKNNINYQEKRNLSSFLSHPIKYYMKRVKWMELKNNERIDDLQFKNLKIIQNSQGFCFGIDAILLSDFAKDMKRTELVVDLCTGTGVIPILLAGKTDAKKIIGVEIQEECADMAKRSVVLNNLEDRVEIVNIDLKLLKNVIPSATVDVVTVNPPYMKRGTGVINEKDAIIISKHEVSCTLEDVIKEAARLLKFNGEFYMIHKSERIADVFCTMRKYKIEPKRVRFVYPQVDKPSNLVLVEGTRSGKEFLKHEKPLIVYKENKEYTDEIYKIYNIKRDEK